jgi:hypothetical protein
MVGPYFTTHKGVRQGDPFCPLLFNLVADGLACMIRKAKEEGLIEGLCRRFDPGGVPGPTSKLSLRAPAQMGWRETGHEGGEKTAAPCYPAPEWVRLQ